MQVHDREFFLKLLLAEVQIIFKFSFAWPAFFGRYEHNAIATSCSINCLGGGILQDVNRRNIIWVQGCQRTLNRLTGYPTQVVHATTAGTGNDWNASRSGE